jgi:predicted lipoprotein with Yx(FWY)xxD motif
MITCRECVNLKRDGDGRSACYCQENVTKEFSPFYGEFVKIKDGEFEYKANKNGNCLWFEPKKQRWWRRKKIYDVTPFENGGVDEFLAFVREKHPEIVFEFKFTKPTGG